MTVTLKRLLGEAGAGLDEAHGFDTLYDVLAAMVVQNDGLIDQIDQVQADHDALVVEYNLLLVDYNAEDAADHVTSSASALAASTADAVTKTVSTE